MKRITQLVQWLLRAWPLLVMLMVACCHYAVRAVFVGNDGNIDKVVGAFLQVVGGLIVLYTINDNIGTFRGQSLFSMAGGWLKEFPWCRRSLTLHAEPITAKVTMSGSVTAHVKRKFNSVEDHLEELQRQIDECRQLVHDREKVVVAAIARVKEELMKEIHTNKEKIDDVNSLLADSVVGGVRAQLLGVLLVIYGAGVSVI